MSLPTELGHYTCNFKRYILLDCYILLLLLYLLILDPHIELEISGQTKQVSSIWSYPNQYFIVRLDCKTRIGIDVQENKHMKPLAIVEIFVSKVISMKRLFVLVSIVKMYNVYF